MSRLQPALAAPTPDSRLFALADGARYLTLDTRLEQAAGEIRSRWLLAGSELDEIAHAGPVLIEFMDSASLSSSGEFLGWLRDWARRSPMTSWLWSRASFENLAKHFAGLLFTRMPDGRRALLRYYSPEVRRALEQVMTARQWTQVMAPLERWQVWQPLQGGYLVYDRETERTADA
ncbi:DUF4123 domain-containing protein [Pseudomonas aeruginosa]|nr:DUF4123 domain-containing protein [Pseudomonas aeruginosa]